MMSMENTQPIQFDTQKASNDSQIYPLKSSI